MRTHKARRYNLRKRNNTMRRRYRMRGGGDDGENFTGAGAINTSAAANAGASNMTKPTQYYLSIDIEAAGGFKSVFAIGAAVFSIKDSTAVFTKDEIFLSFKVPTSESDTGFADFYDDSTWATLWGPLKPESHAVLHKMNEVANCDNEKDLITKFYTWWVQMTIKYHGVRIVTDNPPFDVGRLDSLIDKYKVKAVVKITDTNVKVIDSLPLTKQWVNTSDINYVSTLDYNTYELLYEMKYNTAETPYEAYSKMDHIIGKIPDEYPYSHNPLDDAKRQGYKFAKIWSYLTGLI